jgi:hypothetical protein
VKEECKRDGVISGVNDRADIGVGREWSALSRMDDDARRLSQDDICPRGKVNF